MSRFVVCEFPDTGPLPPETILVTDIDQIMRLLPDTDARREHEQSLADREARAAQVEEQQSQSAAALDEILSDTLPRFMTQIDALVAEREAMVRQDQERKAKEQQQAEERARSECIADALSALAEPRAGELSALHHAKEADDGTLGECRPRCKARSLATHRQPPVHPWRRNQQLSRADMSTLEKDNSEACRRFQEYYDTELCRHVGARAPQPTPGMDVNEYRGDACRQFKRTYLPQVHDLYKVNFRGLADPTGETAESYKNNLKALGIFETQLLAACRTEAENPRNIPAGEIRQITRFDEYGQVKTIDHIGQESFVKQMMRPGRRVVACCTPVDDYGRPCPNLKFPLPR
jgi:hypothetical protein